MKLIRRKADNVVLFAAKILTLDDTGVHGNGWNAWNLDLNAIELLDVLTSVPVGFVGGGWTFINGTWASNAAGLAVILPDKRVQKINELQDKYVSVVYSPITHAGYTWSTDKVSRELLAQVLAAGRVPVGMYWRDITGVPRDMTYVALQDLAYAILERGLAEDLTLMTKTGAVMAATTMAEIDAVS